jgi:hypothetical protein
MLDRATDLVKTRNWTPSRPKCLRLVFVLGLCRKITTQIQKVWKLDVWPAHWDCCEGRRTQYVFNVALTNSMESGPYWKTTSRSNTQEYRNILWNPKVHYRVQRAFDWSISWARWNQSVPSHPVTLILPPDKYENCRSQWPHGLRHEMSSLARTLGSSVRISFEAWMYSFFPCVCDVICRQWSCDGLIPRPGSPTNCL